MAFSHPWLLWLLPLALLPLVFQRAHSKNYSWLEMLPADPLSDLVGLDFKSISSTYTVFYCAGIKRAPY